MLMVALAILCSCSGDDNGNMNFSIIDSCKEMPLQPLSKSEAEPQESISNDTVYFEKRDNGQIFAKIEIGILCGDVNFSLYSNLKEDTLFIDHKSHSEEQAFCSCIAEIEVDIPDDMLSAKYLVLDQWRRSVKTIVFKE